MPEHQNTPLWACSDVRDGGKVPEQQNMPVWARSAVRDEEARWGAVMVKGKGRGRAKHPKHAHMGVLWLFGAMSGEGVGVSGDGLERSVARGVAKRRPRCLGPSHNE